MITRIRELVQLVRRQLIVIMSISSDYTPTSTAERHFSISNKLYKDV